VIETREIPVIAGNLTVASTGSTTLCAMQPINQEPPPPPEPRLPRTGWFG